MNSKVLLSIEDYNMLAYKALSHKKLLYDDFDFSFLSWIWSQYLTYILWASESNAAFFKSIFIFPTLKLFGTHDSGSYDIILIGSI